MHPGLVTVPSPSPTSWPFHILISTTSTVTLFASKVPTFRSQKRAIWQSSISPRQFALLRITHSSSAAVTCCSPIFKVSDYISRLRCSLSELCPGLIDPGKNQCALIDPQFCTRNGGAAPWDYGAYYLDHFVADHDCTKSKYCRYLELPDAWPQRPAPRPRAGPIQDEV